MSPSELRIITAVAGPHIRRSTVPFNSHTSNSIPIVPTACGASDSSSAGRGQLLPEYSDAMLPTIGMPQLVFILVAVLVIWGIYRSRGTRSR